MIRKTDIKRLWDVLMILKHEEDIDDVRKRGNITPPEGWREGLAQQAKAIREGTARIPGSGEELTARPPVLSARPHSSSLTERPLTEPLSTRMPFGTPPGDLYGTPEIDSPSDQPHSPGEAMLTDWEGRKDPVVRAEPHHHHDEGSKPMPSAGGERPKGMMLAQKSLKKSNGSKVLRIFRKYGF